MNNDELLVKIKDIFDAKIDDSARHTAVLIENLESKVQIVAENYCSLYEKVDSLNEKFDSLNEKVDSLNGKVDSLTLRVDKHDARFDKLDKDMETIKGYVIGVDAKLNEHERILKRVK